MRPIDTLLDAAVERVESSGALETIARMGVVSAVAGDGTITVTVADSTLPRVRVLTHYAFPAVGDTVELLRTAGGWVCVGRLATATPAGTVVDMRAGVFNAPIPAINTFHFYTINYTQMRGDQFAMVTSYQMGGTTASTTALVTVASAPTSTSAQIRITRSTLTTTGVHWCVYGIKS